MSIGTQLNTPVTIGAICELFEQRQDRWITPFEAACILNKGRAVSDYYAAKVRRRLKELQGRGYLQQRTEDGELVFRYAAPIAAAFTPVSRLALPKRTDYRALGTYAPGGNWMAPSRPGANDFLSVASRTPFPQQPQHS